MPTGYHWHQPISEVSIKAAHISVMSTSLYSKLHNKPSEGWRRVCARGKYLICNSLSTGKRGLCKRWWWNLLGCDCLWLNTQRDKLVLSSIPQICILLRACACMFSHTLQAHYIPPSPLKWKNTPVNFTTASSLLVNIHSVTLTQKKKKFLDKVNWD